MDDAGRRRLEEIRAQLDALDTAEDVAAVAARGLHLCEDALSLHDKDADPVEWARLQHLLGRYAMGVGYDTSQRDLLRRAVAACEAVQTVHTPASNADRWCAAQHNKAMALTYLAQYGDDLDAYRRATAAFRGALRHIDRRAKPANWASTVNSIGSVHLRMGIDVADVARIRKAMACYGVAAPAWERSEEPEQAALPIYNLGFCLSTLGEMTGDPDCFDRAIATFQRVEGLHDPATRPRDWANTANATAIARAIRGELLGDPDAIAQAIAGFEAILAVMTRTDYPAWWAMVTINHCSYSVRLAELRSDPGGLLRAAERAAAALEVATEAEIPSYWSVLTTVAAEARFRLGEWLGEAPHIARAIAELGPVADSPARAPRDRAAAAHLRGRARLALGSRRGDAAMMGAAIADFDLALAVRTREASPAHWVKTRLARADARRLLGERTERTDLLAAAGQDCDDVLAALPDGDGVPDRAAALLIRGQAGLALLALGGQPEPARVVADFRAARDRLRDDLDPIAVVQARKGEATALLWAGDPAGAAAEADALLTDAAALLTAEPADHARLRLAEALTGVGDLAAYALCRLGQAGAALAVHERGRAHRLRERLRLAEAELSETRRTKLDARRRRLETARRALAAALERERPAAAIARLADGLARQHAALMGQFHRYGLSRPLPPPDPATLAAGVPGGALAMPIAAPPGGAALVVDAAAGSPAVAMLMLPGLTTAAVDRLLNGLDPVGWLVAYSRFRAALESTGGTAGGDSLADFDGAVDRVRAAAWRLLMGPLDAHLRARGLDPEAEVVLIPDGRLAALPLHAAGDGGACFLDRWAVSYAPSLSARTACKRRSQARAGEGGHLLAVTDPAGDLGWPANPAAGFFAPGQTDAFHGAGAARKDVVAALPRATYASFFTHAEWDADRPERSCIRLAGRDRIAAQDFAELALGRCRMVVLGACESGVPGLGSAPDEFQGMPACLIQAGVPGVLATLWPVFNRAADRLLRVFFQAHLRDGLSPAAALRRAQLACRDRAEDWAVGADARFAAADAARPAALGIRRSAVPPAAGAGIPAQPHHDPRRAMYWAAFAYTGA